MSGRNPYAPPLATVADVNPASAAEPAPQRPFWRACFAVFFCYGCFSRIGDYRLPGVRFAAIAAGPLAAGWIVLTLLWGVPDPYSVASDFAFLFIIPVQRRANDINAAIAPGHDRNGGLSWLNWVAVAVGGSLQILAITNAFHPLYPLD